MASRAWSVDEIQVLEQHVSNDDWLDAVTDKITDRSFHAVKTKMSKLRSELGIKGKRGAREEDQDTANAKAVIATHKLLEAIVRAGLRP